MKKRILLLAVIAIVILALCAPVALAAKPNRAPAPTVSITSPANGATVSSAVTISSNCDSGGTGYTVTGVTYAIDSGAATAMTGPNGSASGTWTARWISAVTNGSHTISVTATNSGGKTTTSTISVTVSNTVTTAHTTLVWSDYDSACLSCHRTQFSAMYQSVHYQWKGDAADNVNQPTIKQGKINNEVNSYCINILGDWTHCGKCHAGRGGQPVDTPSPTDAQLLNIDCLVCHNDSYGAARVRLPDGSMGPPATTPQATLDGYAQNIAKPTRKACLMCHAKAGGGDALKRGDLALASMNTTDRDYDVHMASTVNGNVACRTCHTYTNHKVIGKGSDLRVRDYYDANNPHSEVKCSNTTCHPTKTSPTGHTTAAINKHINRVACQTCHIPKYGKNAADTAASEATELFRTWTATDSTTTPYHPRQTKANDQMPKYKWWDRTSNSYLLGDAAAIDPVTGYYATSRPLGSVNGPLGNKLYPFKYKTAEQPMVTADKKLIALDTWEFIWVSGNGVTATDKGLTNMGYPAGTAWQWVITDTYQLLNHQVSPKTLSNNTQGPLACADCHENITRIDLKGQLGYALKGPQSTVCVQCHGLQTWPGYVSGHSMHVDTQHYKCEWCHSFSRPERTDLTR